MNHKTEICYNSIGNSIRFEREMKKKRLLFDGDGGILRHDLRFVYIYCGSGSPSIRALGKYWHNWIHPRNSMSTFRGNRAHGAKCTGNVFISLLSQPKGTDEIETEIDLYGKCIRNHGNTKREYNQCKRENKQNPTSSSAHTESSWYGIVLIFEQIKTPEHSCRIILGCMRFAVAPTPTETNKT